MLAITLRISNQSEGVMKLNEPVAICHSIGVLLGSASNIAYSDFFVTKYYHVTTISIICFAVSAVLDVFLCCIIANIVH